MWKWITAAVIVIAVLVVAGVLQPLKQALTWRRFISPGPLSVAHAFLKDNCAACHTAVVGVTRTNCVTCHSNETALLERQPTAFHANITDCAPCHYEHVAGVERPIVMDHKALARIALAEIGKDGVGERLRSQLSHWMLSTPGTMVGPNLSDEERRLNCVSCHRVNDVHTGNFGDNCATCHATRSWFIAKYVHPSPNTVECAQCHSATPCHYMAGCFQMMGRFAGVEVPDVEPCYACHKTTSWYDFKR